ncbi:MAG TPA: hypothetical protein VMI53_02565 [Opitutaceae bacterium]|nr:hypothetical protein [Opitutaceae bacterium]
MNFPWERFAEDLRTEMGELGGLVRLLELHYEQEPKGGAADETDIETELGAQAVAVQACRSKREKMVESFLPADKLSYHLILPGDILEQVTPEARPLLQALSEEIERLDEYFHRLARGLPAAARQKLDQILRSPVSSLPKSRPADLPVNSGF